MATPSDTAVRPPRIGRLPSGPLDSLGDVPGVSVGHATLADGDLQTGATVVRPHAGNLYRNRAPAAAVVINGFGKSIGLVQLEELGLIDTPIALTNTLSVPAMASAQIRQCIAANPEMGRAGHTVNPLVFECNDAGLNDIQRMALGETHYLQAFDSATAEFEQGSVGAGRGMTCFGLKGGIGSASRLAGPHRLGALVLANHGRPEQLLWAGRALGEMLIAARAEPAGDGDRDVDRDGDGDSPERGSIIIVLATDAPLDSRQLRRLAMRAGAGLARSGSVFGHGSGDIVLAFSTAYTVPHDLGRPMPTLAMLHDAALDPLFQAAADSTEQAIVHALWFASTVVGFRGQRRLSLRDRLAG